MGGAFDPPTQVTIKYNIIVLHELACTSREVATMLLSLPNNSWLCYRSSCTIKDIMSEFLATVVIIGR